MAFSFLNTAQGGDFGNDASSSQATAQDGPELKDIQTNVNTDIPTLSATSLLTI